MAKRLITKTDWTLPPSTIYLDDLKQIEEIVRSCFDAKDTSPEFLYEVDEEFLVDSVEELEAHQGRARSLRIYAAEVSSASIESPRPGRPVLDLSKYSSYIHAPYGSRKSEREFYSSVRDVFELRKRGLQASLVSLPFSGRLGVTSFLLLGPSIVLWGFILLSRMGVLHSKVVLLFGFISGLSVSLVGFAIALTIVFLSLRGRFRINLYHLRERRLKKSEDRKSSLGKIGWVLLGGLATLLFQLIGGLFKH